MRSLTLPLGVIVVSLAATFACTNASTLGENLSTDGNRQTKGDGGGDAADDAPAAQPDATPPPPAKNCTGQGGSSGSDGKGTFACGEVYSCDGQEVSIECSCGPNGGTCKCGDGTTFAHDCTANGCSNTNAERAQCGLPPHAPPGSSGGSSGSTSSSSGASSSGSTSSSSGASGSTSSSGG